MATFKAIMNEVLGTLSEDEVAASITELDSDYHKLIAHFVNQIKEEIEDAHNWSQLWQDLSVTISGETHTAPITGSNQRSRLVRVQQSNAFDVAALVFDITIPTNTRQLIELDYSELVYRRRVNGETVNDAPVYFALKMGTDGTPNVHVYPTPLNTRVLSITMVVPQNRIEFNALDTNILVPNRPLELGVIWYALHERGEELGVNSLYTEERFRQALDSAIARDWAEQGGLDLVAK
jgi:hypothetical protein